MGEEIFIKKEPAKKKKQLTEKQLEGLARGRAKMAEKRAIKLAMIEKKKELAKAKEDAKVVKENTKRNTKARQEKKVKVEESLQQELTMKQKKALADKSSTKFNKLKLEALKQIKTEEDLEEFETIMKGVSKQMERNPDELYSYLNGHSERLGYKAPAKKGKKKSNLSLIVE